MEKKSATKSHKKEWGRAEASEAFLDYVLTEGKLPVSVYAFTKLQGQQETDFYKLFNSFEHLENQIWKTWIHETIQLLEDDASYQEYTVREKLLAFYFTWMQKILAHRSYVMMRFSLSQVKEMPTFLRALKEVFESYIHELIVEGKDTMEIASRPYDQYYPKAFWAQFLMIHRFWMKDMSKDFEDTDALIEKSVRFGLDMIAKGPIDSFQDLAKFLFHHKDLVR